MSRLYNQGGDDAEKSAAGGGTDSDSLNRTGPTTARTTTVRTTTAPTTAPTTAMPTRMHVREKRKGY